MATKKIEEERLLRDIEEEEEITKNPSKKLYCFKCAKEIPLDYKKITKHPNGTYAGTCLTKSKGGCNRKTTFVTAAELTPKSKDKKPKGEIRQIIEKDLVLFDEFKKNPLPNILELILQEHTGTEREQKTALTAFLYIMRILSTKDRSGILKVTGESSAGKSHLVKTLLNFFPKDWIKEIGDASSKALHYVVWKDEKILYIKEGAGSESSTETLKLMDTGDGGFKFLVTVGSPSEGFRAEEIEVPVKFIITTSAKNIFDNELDNRMFSISIDETTEQTALVLFHRCMDFAGHLPTAHYGIAERFIRELREFDEIIVPFSYEFLDIVNRNIRARRDIDKILSLCQTSAFINQHNRPVVNKDGETILFTTPEDAYNVFSLAFSSFEETTTGFTPRMEMIYNSISNEEPPTTYRDIQKITKIPYKEQIKRELYKLENLGLIDINTTQHTHRIVRVENIEKMKHDFNKHKEAFLIDTLIELGKYGCNYEIPLSWYDINDDIDRNKNRNKVKQKIELLQENRNKNCNKTVTKPTIFYSDDDLSKLLIDDNKIETVTTCYGHVSLNVTLPQLEKNGLKTIKCNIVTQPTQTGENAQNEDNEEPSNVRATCYDVSPALKDKYEVGCE